MDISYYPGCTLKTKGINFEKTAIEVLKLFDINLVELKDWYCCGVMFSQASDNLMHQLGPIRTLIKAKETKRKELLTLCSMCYNTLKRSQKFILNDKEKRDKINNFMDTEIDFNGDEVDVIHIFNLIQNIGIKKLKSKVKKDISSIKFAPYYGCLLTKPKEISIVQNYENPEILEEILEGIGFESVYFPFKTECCASFQVVNRREIVLERTKKMINNARENEADFIVLACPLCYYNLDAVQKDILDKDSNYKPVPVLYFTQLLALAFGLDPSLNDFSLHKVDPRPALERKGLL